jgi:hypothetical protein
MAGFEIADEQPGNHWLEAENPLGSVRFRVCRHRILEGDNHVLIEFADCTQKLTQRVSAKRGVFKRYLSAQQIFILDPTCFHRCIWFDPKNGTAESDAGGIKAKSRWLSESDTTGPTPANQGIPGGCKIPSKQIFTSDPPYFHRRI